MRCTTVAAALTLAPFAAAIDITAAHGSGCAHRTARLTLQPTGTHVPKVTAILAANARVAPLSVLPAVCVSNSPSAAGARASFDVLIAATLFVNVMILGLALAGNGLRLLP